MSDYKKHSVTTDALDTLGTIIDEKAGRDAIHLAVEPCIAGMTLRPGEDVGFMEDGTVGIVDKPLGIVDPFLKANVKKGERFWLIVYPRQITSLRHVWVHPDFPDGPPSVYLNRIAQPSIKEQSEQWIREIFIPAHDCPGYETLMEVATDYALNGGGPWGDDYMLFKGSDAHGDFDPEFWYHFEVVTGIKPKYTTTHFSCSC